ncbi:MAG: rane dipeptidase [Gammaproteobacteria bacterium]|nr:rane dipeptidase [Gammaproteobacteria bacterium]
MAEGVADVSIARRLAKSALWAAAVLAALAGVALAVAPYLFAELSASLEPHTIVEPTKPDLGEGRMVDDYWAVQDIDANTHALGEPRYYQANYAYLIVGERRALLFDSGSGTRDIMGVVTSLTHLPVTVMPSHLHFDHTGGIRPFKSVAMIDLPETRADVTNGKLTPSRYEYLGMIDGLMPPAFTVTEWVKPGTTIDLGGRVLQILHVPGHTPSSVALYDAATHQLFAGDFIYPTTLYAFLPGASLAKYRETTRELLATLPADTKIWTAHCCRVGERTSAPWLTMADLRDLDSALTAIKSGGSHSTGLFPRRFPVNQQMTLATGFPWNNR